MKNIDRNLKLKDKSSIQILLQRIREDMLHRPADQWEAYLIGSTRVPRGVARKLPKALSKSVIFIR